MVGFGTIVDIGDLNCSEAAPAAVKKEDRAPWRADADEASLSTALRSPDDLNAASVLDTCCSFDRVACRVFRYACSCFSSSVVTVASSRALRVYSSIFCW